MKKVLFMFFAVAFLASCNTPSTTEETKPEGDSTSVSTTTVTTPSVDSAKVDTVKAHK